MDELVVVSLQVANQIPQTMTSTVQITSELCQAVIYEKINDASYDASQLIKVQQYEQALNIYNQILSKIPLLPSREQREYVIVNLIADEQTVFKPLTQLPRAEQDKWVEWLGKVEEYVLSVAEAGSFAISQQLYQLAEAYYILGRNEQVAIAMQQATTAALQISDPGFRANEFIQIAKFWLQFQQQAEAQQALSQALATVEQMPSDNSYAQGDHLYSIATLYIQLGEARRALLLADKIINEFYPNYIRQEVVRDAIKRGDLHLAQAVTPKIQGAESQALALVDMAVYWATNNQPRLGNRLFAQALKRVAKEEYAQNIQSRLIQIYSTTGQLTISLNAAQRLTQDEAKVLALGAIIVAYAKAKQPQQVQKILAQLTDLIQSEAAVNNVGYINNILQSAVDAGQYSLAIAILNAVKNNANFDSKPYWYRQVVSAQLALPDIDKALQLAKQIPGKFWPEERNVSLQEIAIAYANAQQWNRAIDVLTQIENSAFTPYQVLTGAELAVIAPTPQQFISLIQKAIAQTQALKQVELKAWALAAIAQAYLRAGYAEQTQSFLEKAIQTAQQVEDNEMRGRLFDQMINYLIQQRQYTAALTIAQAHPVSYGQGLAYHNIFEQALPSYTFDVALQVVELETVPDIQATKLLAIAKIYMQLGRNEDAITLLDRAFAVAQKIADPESRVILINEYIEVNDESDRRSQYTRLVRQYVALGQADKAQQVVAKVQEASLRDYLQAWIDC
ncbi:hypothetical protein HCG51_12645 [Tolypothrix sp. PCC 7910]|uniref:hypothetical protein n=1 Tax=Tolypothrix sp. PCC 7910 TaxID=2099387 RepID=UPI0014277FF8|nr:hypothetical protein [Tolypothrix sp. PCC 7910]QIR37474.1 hypothetical protein HCG51_12645 [Tolypothrix sp. PCC 7910]